ncbi:TPA: hypothetical protein RXP51_003421 [Escherichia coli]|uniref:hypothetical protein n=1 Tax=Escherichia coli TaxID=562 RepID=UPI000BDECE18|nr:hypothetical protein [Escherichia coli]EFJ5379670.1 hypothetical protein [Escherichia coli]EIY1871254.1 hypothetical protein [Escherichia coli]HAI8269558.1 hypothetical protein [Escherichia coli]HAI8519879.1 hypothetical protein [Escherichia coli]HEA8637877.1 hypothetical protein [Escherichia coli]
MKLDISVKYFLNIMIADFIIPAPEKISNTWHSDTKMNRFACPIHSTNSDYYSGFYHTDVLIPGELT